MFISFQDFQYFLFFFFENERLRKVDEQNIFKFYFRHDMINLIIISKTSQLINFKIHNYVCYAIRRFEVNKLQLQT